jgi:hypothetical protein
VQQLFSAAFLLGLQKAGKQKHWFMRAKNHYVTKSCTSLRLRTLWHAFRFPHAKKLRPELPPRWQARLIG